MLHIYIKLNKNIIAWITQKYKNGKYNCFSVQNYETAEKYLASPRMELDSCQTNTILHIYLTVQQLAYHR